MTVWQTACWVRTLCFQKGWENGDLYAENFEYHAITGELLQNLNLTYLKNELGIDPVHSHELLSVIQELYPTPSLHPTPSWMQSNLGSELGPPVQGIGSMCGSIQLDCQVLPPYTVKSPISMNSQVLPPYTVKSPISMNSPSKHNYSVRSNCTSLTPLNDTDMGSESRRNFQNCNKTSSPITEKSDSSYPTESAGSESSVKTSDHFSKSQSVCVQGYGVNLSSRICHHPLQDLKISRHGPNGPLMNHSTTSFRKNKTDKCRKLVLTFQSDEQPEGVIDWIRSIFVKFDVGVEIDPMSK